MVELAAPWEIANDLSKNGYRVLLAVQTAGGEARTSKITEITGLSNPLVNYYLKGEGKLIDQELVELVEEDELELDKGLNVPRDGYLYRLTERGRETLSAAQEEYQLTALEEGEVRRRFDDLEERMSRVEERLDQVVADVDANSEAAEENDEMIQGLGRAGKAAARRIEELEEEVAELRSRLS